MRVCSEISRRAIPRVSRASRSFSPMPVVISVLSQSRSGCSCEEATIRLMLDLQNRTPRECATRKPIQVVRYGGRNIAPAHKRCQTCDLAMASVLILNAHGGSLRAIKKSDPILFFNFYNLEK